MKGWNLVEKVNLGFGNLQIICEVVQWLAAMSEQHFKNDRVFKISIVSVVLLTETKRRSYLVLLLESSVVSTL